MITEIHPTPCLRDDKGMLQRRIILRLWNEAEAFQAQFKFLVSDSVQAEQALRIPEGESEHEVFAPEPDVPQETVCVLQHGDSVVKQSVFELHPAVRWHVHVVQISHHDLGYTGVPSNVLSKHARYLDQAIDLAEETSGNPPEAKFRITIEQAWSVDHFLRHASEERVKKMIELMRTGQFELTVLYGNMISELCGHESLIRALYPSFELKKKYGIPIISAEHNDIPGFSWGLCRLLTDAGIKIFCPGIPLYYNWSSASLQSFWDQKAIFGFEEIGRPGAFWWEAATGKKVLFWCNNSGCGGSSDPRFPGLLETLEKLEGADYPANVLRWPVQGGKRDNSPYIVEFAESIKRWNEMWAFPKLICSTNAHFYNEFSKVDLSHLPVHRGELPGQDYPVGATSTARPTGWDRNNQRMLLTAEQLALIAGANTDYEYQQYELSQAWKNTLRFEEHAWGHTYSHGPAMVGAESEKSAFAGRATAYAHDVQRKALANIADNIRKETNDVSLVVFNPLGNERTRDVRIPMRELENSEIIMEDRTNFIAASSLPGRAERSCLPLPDAILNGNFKLMDTTTGEAVPFEMVPIEATSDEAAYAPQRSGLAQGRKDYFNHPEGWKYDICFTAEKVPGAGYKTYRVQMCDSHNDGPVSTPETVSGEDVIENEFYRISFDCDKNCISSIFDKEKQAEMLDADATHSFGELVVRSPDKDSLGGMSSSGPAQLDQGNRVSTATLCYSAPAHPVVRETIVLYSGIKRIDLAVKILKDATPLLDVHLAFPFAAQTPKFRYEGSLNVLEPVKDFLPGAYSDALTAQNWVMMADGDYSLTWASHDAPVVQLGQLWPGYVSPAHTCVTPSRMPHAPQTADDFNRGWMYSTLFNNNFTTNFSVSQSGEFSFRYSITTAPKALSAPEAIRTGQDLGTPMEFIFSPSYRQGNLPQTQSFVNIEHEDVILLSGKRAAEGTAAIMRFWNPLDTPVSTRVESAILNISDAREVTPAEEETDRELVHDRTGFALEMDAQEIKTVSISG